MTEWPHKPDRELTPLDFDELWDSAHPGPRLEHGQIKKETPLHRYPYGQPTFDDYKCEDYKFGPYQPELEYDDMGIPTEKDKNADPDGT